MARRDSESEKITNGEGGEDSTGSTVACDPPLPPQWERTGRVFNRATTRSGSVLGGCVLKREAVWA